VVVLIGITLLLGDQVVVQFGLYRSAT